MRTNKRGNVWSVTRKRKSWTVHYFYFICGRKFQTRKHVKKRDSGNPRLENDKLAIERSALPYVVHNMSVRSSFV